jgi:hypothetical protein
MLPKQTNKTRIIWILDYDTDEAERIPHNAEFIGYRKQSEGGAKLQAVGCSALSGRLFGDSMCP